MRYQEGVGISKRQKWLGEEDSYPGMGYAVHSSQQAERGKELAAGRSCDTICKADLFKFYRTESAPGKSVLVLTSR